MHYLHCGVAQAHTTSRPASPTRMRAPLHANFTSSQSQRHNTSLRYKDLSLIDQNSTWSQQPFLLSFSQISFLCSFTPFISSCFGEKHTLFIIRYSVLLHAINISLTLPLCSLYTIGWSCNFIPELLLSIKHGSQHNSRVEYLPTMCSALGLISSTTKTIPKLKLILKIWQQSAC